LIVVVLLVFDIVRSGGAFSSIQVLGIANQALPLACAAIGETLVILTNGIDLSIGSILTVSNVTLVELGKSHLGAVGVAGALAIGVLAGLVNGLVVCYLRIAPLIATLATGSIFLGVALIILPEPGGRIPGWLAQVTVGSIGSVPVAVIWLVILSVLGWIVLRRTTFGINVQALGGSESASWSGGVPVVRVRILAYVVAGSCAALGGVVLGALTGSGAATSGASVVYLLDAIAALVVGGTSLAGGVGTLVGAVLGAIVLSLVSTVLFVSGLPTSLQYVVTGCIVIGALFIQAQQSRHPGNLVGTVLRRAGGRSKVSA
jgi:ribose transport system permease protein